MKTKYIIQTLLMLFIALTTTAQQGINYKAIINDADGNLLANTAITVQFTILENATTLVYSETHDIITDANGIMIVNIGEGTVLSGDFSTIQWGSAPHYLKTQIDKGEGLVDMGTTEFMTVPYALYSRSSGGRLPVCTSAEIDELAPIVGEAVYNVTEKLLLIYNGNHWQPFNATSQCWPQPDIANAGPDQFFYDGTTSTSLGANTPNDGYGAGEWSIINGEGGSFSNTGDPSALFTGKLNESYTLQWTISTNCNLSTHQIKVLFASLDYGEDLSDIDGNTYKTIWVGDQLWMAENIKTTHYADGTAIPLVTDRNSWGSLGDNNVDKAYCYYKNSAGNGETYGALYTWAAAMNGANSSVANPSNVQGVCPTGWHLPSDNEWKEMEMHIGMSQIQADNFGYRGTTEGSKLAGNLSLWAWGETISHSDFGMSGFGGLPGGQRLASDYYLSPDFTNIGYAAYWWTSSEDNSNSSSAMMRMLYYQNSFVWRGTSSKSDGNSVRCVKD